MKTELDSSVTLGFASVEQGLCSRYHFIGLGVQFGPPESATVEHKMSLSVQHDLFAIGSFGIDLFIPAFVAHNKKHIP